MPKVSWQLNQPCFEFFSLWLGYTQRSQPGPQWGRVMVKPFKKAPQIFRESLAYNITLNQNKTKQNKKGIPSLLNSPPTSPERALVFFGGSAGSSRSRFPPPPDAKKSRRDFQQFQLIKT
eukprot:TRINITY_DN1277_c0_g1_i10.p1 TRINITY_DN1277_c0_g1~~TRINITY_DN1277_c0_g1_i10.p1  ORF type:complete len:120 (-),score=2.76 TRINITY_DN1277_c0_g1_i10:21-380(-)